MARTLSEGKLFARIYHERCIMAVPFFVQSSDDMLLAGSHTLTGGGGVGGATTMMEPPTIMQATHFLTHPSLTNPIQIHIL